jgi:hypothetical protein
MQARPPVGQVGNLQRVGNPLRSLTINSESADRQSARRMPSCPTSGEATC